MLALIGDFRNCLLNFLAFEFAGNGVEPDTFHLSHERKGRAFNVDIGTECALLDAESDPLNQMLPPEVIESS
jgi:hypothetical protein